MIAAGYEPQQSGDLGLTSPDRRRDLPLRMALACGATNSRGQHLP